MTNRLASETALFIDNKMDNFYFLFLKKRKRRRKFTCTVGRAIAPYLRDSNNGIGY